MKYFSHVNTAADVIQTYLPPLPFSIHLKEYLSKDKKYGSTDRKNISQLCYAFFRLGKAMIRSSEDFANKDWIKHRILVGSFLVDPQPTWLQQLKPEWFRDVQNDCSVDTKLQMLKENGIDFNVEDIFPWPELLSDGIDYSAFCRSFLQQPDLFIRIRPGNRETVFAKLIAANTVVDERYENCLALPPATKVHSILDIDKEVVIQDLSSQRVAEFFNHIPRKEGLAVWDCCAGSGGKSILAYDHLPNILLTVSDVRESIINNLHQRFDKAGIKKYDAFVVDLTRSLSRSRSVSPSHLYNLIICDAPCTGSGTWSRTPEQLTYFDPSLIGKYSARQQQIVSAAMKHLKPGGHVLYITCSVFREENEGVMEFLNSSHEKNAANSKTLAGYDRKADSLFAKLC